MKKVIRIAAITLGVILLLLLIAPVLFKSKIEAMVKEKITEEVHAKVDWTSFGLSFFRGFPDLSINLHQLSLVGMDPFGGDTLAGIERFELRVNPFSAIRRNLEVKTILIRKPLVNGMVLEDGRANWDIASGREDLDEEEAIQATGVTESAFSLSLHRLSVVGGRIYYADQGSGIDASLEGLSLELKGDLSMEQTELDLVMEVEKLNAKLGGVRYLRDAVLQVDLLAAANLVENRYVLKENFINLNGLSLGAEGEVTLLDEGAMEMDLAISSRETSFKTLLSMVPAIYRQDFESLETRGSLQLDARVHGIMKDSIFPDAKLLLQVKDGYFAYPDLPKDVSDVQITLQVDYRGENMDATLVDLEQLHFLLGGNPFDLHVHVDHPLSDMHVVGRAEGIIDFASIRDVVPLEDISLSGRLETRISWDALMSQIEQEQYEQVHLAGSLRVEDVLLETADLPVPVALERLSMLFNPRIVELSEFDMRLGSSDLHMKGQLENFIPYVFNDQTVSGGLALSSNLVNANELLPETDSDLEESGGDTIVPVPPDSLAQSLGIRIPENIDFAMAVDVKRIEYRELVLENMTGSMRVTGGVAGIEHLQMDAVEGTIASKGYVDTRGEYAEVDISLQMTGVDIPSAYTRVMSVKKLVPMAKYCRGSANIEMQYHSLLDNTFTPLYESIDAKGDAYTRGLQFFNLGEFVPLSQLLKNEKFTKMAPDEVDVGFTVRDGRIIFNPFDWKVDDSEFQVSGSHGMDLSMDYEMNMQIAKSDLGAGANELMQGVTLLAAGAGISIPQSDYIKVKAHLGGSFNQPEFTTDLSENLRSSGEQVRQAMEARISGEVERVEEQLRDEATEQAEKIIGEAEAEAARLVEEARKAGEALVKEAENQGEKLMKEAGSNPLKQVAARTAANELIRQSENQSEKMVIEAERKGEEIIQRARSAAGQL